MKRLSLILAALSAAWATAAHATLLMTGVGGASGLATFAATAPTPTAAIMLGIDNAQFQALSNVGIGIPAGATNVPATAGNYNFSPFFGVLRFRAEPMSGDAPAGSNPYTLASRCTSSACTTNNTNHVLYIQSGNNATTPNHLYFGASTTLTANNMTGTGAIVDTGITVVPGLSYTAVISEYSTGQGTGKLTIMVNGADGQAANGSPYTSGFNDACSVGGGETNFFCTAGVARTQAAIGDFFQRLGTGFTTTNANQRGTSGALGDFAWFQAAFPNTSGTPSTVAMTALSDGSKSLDGWATTYSLQPLAYFPLTPASASIGAITPANPVATTTTWASAQANGSVAFGSPATTFGGATVGSAVANIVPASPLVPSSCLKLYESGPWDVAPLDAGSLTTGAIKLSGTFDSTKCGGTVTGIDGRIRSIKTGALVGATTPLTIVGNTYSGFVTGLGVSTAANGYYTQEVCIHNTSPLYCLAGGYPIGIGFVEVRIGQSQVNRMFIPGTTATGHTGSNLVGNGTLTVHYMQQGLTNPNSNNGFGTPSTWLVTAVNNPGGGASYQQVGDGILEEMQDVSAGLGGIPVKAINLAKSGQGSDAWACDYSAQTAALTGSGTGAYLNAAMFASGNCTQAGAFATLKAGSVFTIKKGTLAIKDAAGVTVAVDTTGCADTTTAQTCNLSSAGSATVTGGTVSHMAGTIAGLTFASDPRTGGTGALTAFYTAVEDTQSGAYNQNSPYGGFGVFGDGVNAASGYGTAMLLGEYQPPNIIVFEQATNDGSDLSIGTPTGDNTTGYPRSWQTKWNYTLNTRIGSMPFAAGRTVPILVLGYARDSGSGADLASAERQALANMAGIAGSGSTATPMTNALYGGAYIDGLTECPTSGAQNCFSPHEAASTLGAQRMARRAAQRIIAYQKGELLTTVAEPSIVLTGGSKPTFSASGNGSVTFHINLPNGGAIATCGSNLSLGNNAPPASASGAGTVCVTTTSGNVYGFRFGADVSHMFNQAGVNESSQASSWSLDDTKQFACAIASSSTVTCTNTFGGGVGPIALSALWSYGGEGGADLAGTLLPLGTLTPGTTTYTGAGLTQAMTGGTCTTHPTITFTLTGGAGTTLASAKRATPGVCTVGDTTVVFPTVQVAGTASSLVTSFEQIKDDINLVGQLLYDNTGVHYGVPSGYEPGMPVTPVNVTQTITP